jgi:hypothetical protein
MLMEREKYSAPPELKCASLDFLPINHYSAIYLLIRMDIFVTFGATDLFYFFVRRAIKKTFSDHFESLGETPIAELAYFSIKNLSGTFRT